MSPTHWEASSRAKVGEGSALGGSHWLPCRGLVVREQGWKEMERGGGPGDGHLCGSEAVVMDSVDG